MNLITLKGENEQGKLSVAGTLIGKRNEPRLVKVYDFDMDIAPSKHMAFFRYEDKPGVIGAVGTTLGKSNINIGTMQVGRDVKRGEAVMGINVDSPIPPEVLDEIRKVAHIKEAKFITF
jgi:D-3-phosphoglycerate dehydrogenase